MGDQPSTTFPAVCVFAGADGTSHLVDLDLPAMGQKILPDGTSEFSGVCGATVFGVVAGDQPKFVDWHIAKHPGLSIVLSGAWEIEAGSGQRRVLQTGSVLLMFDNSGQGHRAHHVDGKGGTVIGIGLGAETEALYRALLQQKLGA